MKYVNNQPSKWEDMEYSCMSHEVWGGFAKYLGNYAKNKMMVKFP